MKRRLHDEQLWERLYQTIKVEEPVEFGALRRFCRDVPVSEVDWMLSEMERCGRVRCSREWRDDAGRSDLRLTYQLDSMGASMKKKKIPSDEEAVRMVEKMTDAPRGQIARVIGERVFTCVGCGQRIVSDGTPRTRAFVWTHVKTKKRSKYCYNCDDKLIQGVM